MEDIIKACRKKGNYTCIGMTEELKRELEKDGLLE